MQPGKPSRGILGLFSTFVLQNTEVLCSDPDELSIR